MNSLEQAYNEMTQWKEIYDKFGEKRDEEEYNKALHKWFSLNQEKKRLAEEEADINALIAEVNNDMEEEAKRLEEEEMLLLLSW